MRPSGLPRRTANLLRKKPSIELPSGDTSDKSSVGDTEFRVGCARPLISIQLQPGDFTLWDV